MRANGSSLCLQTWLVVTGVLAALLGAAVLTGWYGQLPWLIQISPGLVPMAPRSAISFLCFGSALVALVYGREKLAAALVALVALSNGLTVLIYSASLPIHLDQLLHIPSGVLPVKAVAPNTAAAFLALSVAMLVRFPAHAFRGRSLVLALLSSAACALAVSSLIGYLSGLKTFEWGHLAPMAPHTSMGLVLLSTCLFLLAWEDGRSSVDPEPGWLWISATLVSAVAMMSLAQALAAEQRAQVERAVASDLAQLRGHLLAQLQTRISPLTRAAARWGAGGGPSPNEWKSDTSMLLGETPELRALAWVDSGRHVRRVAPEAAAGRGQSAGLDVQPLHRAALENALAAHRPVLTRANDSWIEGRAIEIYVPSCHAGTCQGILVGIFPLQEMLRGLTPPYAAPDEQVRIFDGVHLIYQRSPDVSRLAGALSQRQPLGIGVPSWTLEVTPSAAKLAGFRSPMPGIVLVSGLLLSILLGIAIRLGRQARQRQHAAEAMRRELDKESEERRIAELRLEQFFAVSPELLCITDRDCRFQNVNPAWKKVLGYSQEELRKESLLSLAHPEDRELTASAVRHLTGAAVYFENRIRDADGSYHWLQWSWSAPSNQPLIFASARDITEQKQTGQALARA